LVESSLYNVPPGAVVTSALVFAMLRHLDIFTPAQRLTLAAATALVLVTGALEAAGAPNVALFVLAALGLAALAALVGEAVEQVGARLGPGPTGLLQSSIGNLPELLVGIFALRAGLTAVVQAALIGSVLGNVLLVLGIAFLTGGARHGAQRFDPEAPRMLVTLLTLAAGATLVPTLASRLETPAAHHTAALSDITAVVLLLVYLASIPFWLSGGPHPVPPAERGPLGPTASAASTSPLPARPQPGRGAARAEGTAGHATEGTTAPATEGTTAPGRAAAATSSPRRGAPWPLGPAVAVLAAAGVASGVVSDWFVSSLTPATKSLGISPVFTGLVIVAIASNAVENVAGIRFAWKARPDYAISTILNSPLQITLLLTPVLVLISPLIGPAHLTLVFPPLLVVALAVAVVVVGVVVYDGEYSWLEGVALIALYVVVGAAFWWG
jgi:Ca2+:H+ antiporter